MLLRETGFTFDGKHCMNDFGMMYSEGSGHPVIPAILRNEYEIAGMSGTVLMDGEVRRPLTFTGTLYPHREPASQAEAQQLLRRLQTWLCAGRRRLVFDYEPDKFYLAQLTRGSMWSLKNWFGGELSVTFQAEPWAFAVRESSWSQSITGETSMQLRMATGVPAPTRIMIENTGNTYIDAVEINGGQIAFSEYSNWRKNYTMFIDSEPPINGRMATSADAHNIFTAMMRCTAFRPHELANGLNTLVITPVFHEGAAGSAQVTVTARGRW